MNIFGIKFKCTLEEYLSVPSGTLAFDEGLRFSYNPDTSTAVIRSFCDTDDGEEKEVTLGSALDIMWHVVVCGLK